MSHVYFDNNATTPVDAAVLVAMLPFLTSEFGNASSIHSVGQRSRAAIEKARAQVATLLGAQPSEIVFTSGGTEGNNLAIFGLAGAAQSAFGQGLGRPHVITTQIEHSAVLNPCQALAERGFDVTFLAVSAEGVVSTEAVREALRPETVLIAVMLANNEVGTLQPIAEIGRLARQSDVWFHCDAVQAAGKIPVNVEELGVDTLAISGHKIYAPKGVGALYVRRGVELAPLIYGGHHERDRRPGTENVAGSVALGRAAEIAGESLPEEGGRLAALRNRFEQAVVARVSGARINCAASPRVPNTSSITFAGLEGEALVIAVDLKGLACSTGAACSSGAIAPSRVLTAIGLPAAEARASLRFSLGRQTTDADVDFALRAVVEAVARLRELAPGPIAEAAPARAGAAGVRPIS
jgi:cysteine desulfurase